METRRILRLSQVGKRLHQVRMSWKQTESFFEWMAYAVCRPKGSANFTQCLFDVFKLNITWLNSTWIFALPTCHYSIPRIACIIYTTKTTHAINGCFPFSRGCTGCAAPMKEESYFLFFLPFGKNLTQPLFTRVVVLTYISQGCRRSWFGKWRNDLGQLVLLVSWW